MRVAIMVAEPRTHLVNRGFRDAFIEGVRASALIGCRLGRPQLVAVSGERLDAISDEEQDAAIVSALKQAAPVAAEHGIDLLLEPLNDRVDHPGAYLTTTPHGLDLVEAVDESNVRLLYDIYHSATMGEQPVDVLGDRAALVGHVHVADTPGRHEPGTGDIDWEHATGMLERCGYAGPSASNTDRPGTRRPRSQS